MEKVKIITAKKWFLNTLLGYSLGVSIVLMSVWLSNDTPLIPVFPFGVITGLCVGYFQFRALKDVMEIDSSWVWGYALGSFLAKLLFVVLNPLLDHVLDIQTLYILKTAIGIVITGIYQTKLLNKYGYSASSVYFITYVVSSITVLMMPFVKVGISEYLDMLGTPEVIDYAVLIFSLFLMPATSALAMQYIQKQTGLYNMSNADNDEVQLDN